MIKLGLGKIFSKRREPSHSGLQTLSEMVELLEPSPLVLQALSETVAWCLYADRCNRTSFVVVNLILRPFSESRRSVSQT